MSIQTERETVPVTREETAGDYLWAAPSRAPAGRLNGAIVFLIATALIAAVGMLYLLQTNHIARLGYEMSALQEQREAALVEQQKLAARIAARQAITTVERTARRDLGLRPMEDYVFLDVELPPEQPALPQEAAPKPSAWESLWGRLSGRGSSSDTQRDDGGTP
jgi:cell division protein FtsL